MSATPHAREGWKSKIVTITVIICTIQAVCTHAWACIYIYRLYVCVCV
jgi:hypothetical protein